MELSWLMALLLTAALLIQPRLSGGVELAGRSQPAPSPRISVRPAVMAGRPCLICEMKRPPANRLLRFRWLSGIMTQPTTLSEAVTRRPKYHLAMDKVRLGDTVQCQVTEVDGDGTNITSMRSAPQPLGLLAHVLTRSSGLSLLEVKVTAPVVCRRGDSCQLRLRLVQANDTDDMAAHVLLSHCQLTLNCTRGRCYSETGDILIKPQRTSTMVDISQLMHIHIINRSDLGDIWQSYQPPPFHIKFQVTAPAPTCHLVTANHIIGFDGTQRQFSRAGVLLLYIDPVTGLTVSARSRHCGPAFCSCSVSVRDSEDTMTVSVCRGGREAVHHITRDPAGTVSRILKVRHRPAWVFALASGAVLRVQRVTSGPLESHAVLSVSITVGVDTRGEGLCVTPAVDDRRPGLWNNRWTTAGLSEAARARRRTVFSQRSLSACHCTDAVCERAPPQLPRVTLRAAEPVPAEYPRRRHRASHHPPRRTASGGAERRRQGGHRSTLEKRSPGRTAAPETAPAPPAALPPAPAPTPTSWLEGLWPPVSQRRAAAGPVLADVSCEHSVLNSSLAAACSPLVNDSFLRALINICHRDRAMFGPAHQTEPVMSALQNHCEHLALATGATGHVAALMAGRPCRRELCPVPVPVTHPDRPPVLCDLSTSACSHVTVPEHGTARPRILLCYIKQTGRRNTVVVPATYRSEAEAQCQLPATALRRLRHADQVTYWEIQISSDMSTNRGLAYTFVTYNGDCRTCAMSGSNVTCSGVSGSCAINGLCYKRGDTNPVDPCQFCRGGTGWTNRTDASCEGRAGTGSLQCSTGSLQCGHGLCVEDARGVICACEPGYIGAQCEFQEWSEDVKHTADEPFDIEELQSEGDELVYSVNAVVSAQGRRT